MRDPVLAEISSKQVTRQAWDGPILETVVDGIRASSSGNAGFVSLSPLSRWDRMGILLQTGRTES